MLERNTHKTRADTCIITTTGKQYIDVAIENSAAASYLPKMTVDAQGFAVWPEAGTWLAVEIRTMEKFRSYCPVLGEDAAQDFYHCVPFIVDATGNCSDVALRLLLEGSKETRATSNVLSKSRSTGDNLTILDGVLLVEGNLHRNGLMQGNLQPYPQRLSIPIRRISIPNIVETKNNEYPRSGVEIEVIVDPCKPQ